MALLGFKSSLFLYWAGGPTRLQKFSFISQPNISKKINPINFSLVQLIFLSKNMLFSSVVQVIWEPVKGP